MTDTAASMPDQRSLFEQVSDLWRFARQQKMYDAQDWLAAAWKGSPLPSSLGDPSQQVPGNNGGVS